MRLIIFLYELLTPLRLSKLQHLQAQHLCYHTAHPKRPKPGKLIKLMHPKTTGLVQSYSWHFTNQVPKNVSLRNLSHPYQFKPRMFRWGPQHGPRCHSSNRQGSVAGDPRCWRYTRQVGLPIAYFTKGISQVYLLLLMVQKSQSQPLGMYKIW